MADQERKEIKIPVRVQSNEVSQAKVEAQEPAPAETPQNPWAKAEAETDEEFLNRIKDQVEQDAEHVTKAHEIGRLILEALENSTTAWVNKRAEAIALLVDLGRQAYENRDRWVRSVAELDNQKKRSFQDRTKLLKYRNEELLRDILPVVDNLHRALDAATQIGGSGAFIEGVEMIAAMLKDVLHKHGVTEISALGEMFDPARHEAVARVPVFAKESNIVVEELEKGYMYQDRLLRASKVVLSSGEPEPNLSPARH